MTDPQVRKNTAALKKLGQQAAALQGTPVKSKTKAVKKKGK